MKVKPNIILYIGVGFIFFIFWMMVVFPRDAVKSRIITEIENQTGGKYHLGMKEMEVSVFLGNIVFEDLKIKQLSGGQGETLLETPKLKVGFSPLGVLSQKMDFSFFLKGKKSGDLEGDYRKEGAETDFSMELDNYPLEELKFLASKAKVALQGKVDGEIELKIDPTKPQNNKGKVDIQFENLSTGATKIAIDPSDPASAMPLPAIKLSGKSGSHIKAKVVKDQLNIEAILLKGGDLDLDLKGKVLLKGRSAKDYRLDVKGGFKISPNLAKALPFYFLIEKQKNEKDVFPLTLSGRLGKPNIQIGNFRVPI